MKFTSKGVSSTTIGLAVVLVIVVVGAGAYIAFNPGHNSTTTVTSTSTSTQTSTSISTLVSTQLSTSVSTSISTFTSTEATNTALSGTVLETGSSLLYPAFVIWVPAFEQVYPNLQVTPASTGSGTGQAQAESGAVQVGASDAYLTPAQVQANPGVLNIPLAISAQQVNYNIPVNGLNNIHLNMSAAVLAGIYNGTITKWNDPAIKAIQSPSVAAELPSNTIIPIHRQDSSGDTFIFTSYLSAGDSAWNSTVGYGTTVSWPAVPGSLAATGNPGMVTATQSTPYSIAYIGISFLDTTNQLGLGYAFLQNRAGNFVDITPANIQAAVTADAPSTPSTETKSLIYAPGANSYPIVNFEYAIVKQTQPNSATAANVKALLTWCITYGNQQVYLEQVHFTALPSAVVQLSLSQVNSITG